MYILAKELHIDIDEVKRWPAEKIIKWSIALEIISKEIEKRLPKPQDSGFERSKNYLFVFR